MNAQIWSYPEVKRLKNVGVIKELINKRLLTSSLKEDFTPTNFYPYTSSQNLNYLLFFIFLISSMHFLAFPTELREVHTDNLCTVKTLVSILISNLFEVGR